mmetsp:Transcript_17981/g.12914  ORF Transcript_17981/g.12914 Transcript_17981/m.12914 type:complete len:120 (-) Transcript_17981:128-487(-)
MMVPGYVRIRIPKNIFRATDNGYSLLKMYQKCKPYKDSYYYILMFIRTTKNQIFGCFMDTVPIMAGNKFIGGTETFVFSVQPRAEAYYFTEANMRFALCDLKYMTVGANGEGPAIRIDE